MSSQRTFFKIIFSVVALVLLLHISFSLISASPAQAKEAEQPRTETFAEELLRKIDYLIALVEELSDRNVYILLLRIEQNVLGDSVTLNNQMIYVAVDRRSYESFTRGDEVTNSRWVQNLSEPLVGEIRIIVADKFIDPQ